MFRSLATLAIVGVAVALLVPKRAPLLSDDLFPEGNGPEDRSGGEVGPMATGTAALDGRDVAETRPDPAAEAGEESVPASGPPSFNPGAA